MTGSEGIVSEQDKADLAKAPSQNDLLKFTLAAQEKLECIRRDFAALRVLIDQVRALRAGDGTLTDAQKKFLDELCRQEQGCNSLFIALSHLSD